MSRTGRSLLFQILGLLALISAGFLAVRLFPVAEWLRSAEGWMANAGPLGFVVFPLLYALVNVLLLPGGILNIGAGFFFGVWPGFLLVLAGSVLSAAISFCIGRTLGRSWIESHWLQNPKFSRLDHAIAREGWKIILLSQLNPLFPTSLINYLYGVSKIRFWTCIAWVAIGQAPSRLLYAYLGAAGSYGLDVAVGQAERTPMQDAVWVAGLGAAVLATMVLASMAHRILRKLGADPEDLEVEMVPELEEPELPEPHRS